MPTATAGGSQPPAAWMVVVAQRREHPFGKWGDARFDSGRPPHLLYCADGRPDRRMTRAGEHSAGRGGATRQSHYHAKRR